MDGIVKSQTYHDRSLIALLKSSPSSSSLSSSSRSYSSSSSWTAEHVLHTLSPVRTGSKVSPEGEQSHVAENEGMGFINDTVGHSGMEWKDVEKRFDQVSWTGSGTEPVVTWSGFGFCIGMQSSPELAKELLRALRGGKDWKSDITKTDLHNFWFRMKDDSFNSRMRIFFDM